MSEPPALEQREARHRETADAGEQPEGWARTLTAPDHAEDGGGERQEADEHDGMRRGDVLERQRRQEGKTDDDHKGDDDERNEVADCGTALTQGEKHRRAEQGRDHRPRRGQEERREPADRHPRRRQRGAEDDDAHEAVAPPRRIPLHRVVSSRLVSRDRTGPGLGALTIIPRPCRQMLSPRCPCETGMMNPAHLDLFRAVLRHGGMTRAAAALGIGQPHVSRAMAQLEADLGFALFVRGHGSVLPTQEGEAFAREVERTYAGLDHLSQAAR